MKLELHNCSTFLNNLNLDTSIRRPRPGFVSFSSVSTCSTSMIVQKTFKHKSGCKKKKYLVLTNDSI
eukprot:snap_masked-scaffold_14-processed-gene-9.7-mRNA-1 protein AED:1.00 eAED:1.00 QI:0/0/0/0/1/1/3/0/66